MKKIILILLLFGSILSGQEGQSLIYIFDVGIGYGTFVNDINEPDIAVYNNNIAILTNYRVLNNDYTSNIEKTIGLYISTNFGDNWNSPIILPKTNNYSMYSDPSVDFDSDGNLYCAFVGINSSPDYNSAIIVNKSSDLGQTWLPSPYIVADDNSSNGIRKYDKPYLYVDRNTNNIYITFSDSGNKIMVSHMDSGTEGFTLPSIVNDIGVTDVANAGIPIIDNNGYVYVIYFAENSDENTHTIIISKSTNNCSSFSKILSRDIGLIGNSIENSPFKYFGDKINHHYFRVNNFPFITIDNNNNIYAIFPTLINNLSELEMWKSTNGGNSWNSDVITEEISGNKLFPGITINKNGILNIIFSKFDDLSSDLLYVYLMTSLDGGATFETTELSNFDYTKMHQKNFLGDYVGLISNDNYALGAWTQVDSASGREYIMFNKINVFPEPIIKNEMSINITSRMRINDIIKDIAHEGTRIGAFPFIQNKYEIVDDYYVGSSSKYYFRNWDDGSFLTLKNTQFDFDSKQYVDHISSYYQPTHPLTVNNYLEGGSGGSYDVTWTNPDPVIQYQNQNSGSSFDAFDFTKNSDYYKIVIASTIQNTYGTDWHFQNWEDGTINTTINNLSVTAPTTKTAYYKGSMHSDNSNAFSNSGQRKVITTANGTMYFTYESMNSVWLEKSTDNGSNWYLINNGKPLDSGGEKFAKSPSLALDYDTPNNIYLVYQGYAQFENYIFIAYFDNALSVPKFVQKVPIVLSNDSNIDFEPVLAKTYRWKMVLVFKCSTLNEAGPGLYYYYGKHDIVKNPPPAGITWYGSPVFLNNTSNNSSKPALAARSSAGAPFHLVWQENSSQIRYYELDQTANNTITPTGYSTISSGSGYTKNEKPTITMYGSEPQVSWIGTKTVSSGKGEARTTTTYHKVIKRGKSQSGIWDIFYTTGNEVKNISSNGTTDGNYVIAWVEENTPGNYADKFNKNMSSNKQSYSLGTTAKYLQLSNGADLNNMYATTYKTTSLPYPFEQSASIGSNLQKGGEIASGRQGVVYRENAEFYFAIGDIYLGNDLIDFEEVEDTTYVNDLSHINSYLETKPFEVNNNSTVTYSVLYGLTDSTASAEILEAGDNVNFKVELVDAQSGNVIGAYDDVTYTKNSLDNYDNLAYEINTEGIGNRTVKLRLVVNDNLNGGYGFSKIFGEDNVLGKFGNPVEQNFQGTMEVKKYDLTQNYPNPFNPSTIIKYQLPKEGYVTLKVYDILGREIATLVNQKQSIGRYQATFDASKLAAGVYIYRLTVRSGLNGNFTTSKKMILLK